MTTSIFTNAQRGVRVKPSFRPDIEGLRGIAVLLVVLFHAGVPGVTGGFVGVDVFFALSGYLITGLLVQEVEASGHLCIHEFYARRVRRLLPASALVLLVSLVAGYLLLAPEELSFLARAARGTALYMSNIFFMRNAGDYFAPGAATNPLLHTWSLAVEEQFYVVWPWLIILALWRSHSRKRLVAVMLLITVVSLAGCVWLTEHLRTMAFYGSWSRAWEFGLGGLASMLSAKAPGRRWRTLGWVGLALVLASGCFIREEAFPGMIAALPVMGTVLALISGTQGRDSALLRFLSIRPLQFLGKMSYSWYLWHWPVLVCAAAVMPWMSWPGRLLWACGALVLATIAYRWIESPLRFHPWLKTRPALSLGLGAALTAVCFGAAVGAMRVATSMASAPILRPTTAAAEGHLTYPSAECFSTGMDPTVRPCTFGKLDSDLSLAIFGDSHAAVWFGPARDIAERQGWKLTTYLKSGCPATSVFLIHPTLGWAAGEACSHWRAEAIRQLIATPPALILIADATSPYLQNGERGASGTRVSLDGWRDGTRTTLKALTDRGIEVIQMRDNPSAKFDIPTCLARATVHSWYPKSACDLTRDTALSPEVFQSEQDAAKGIAGVHFIDFSDQFCQGQSCPTMKDGLILYQDSNHISGGFARQLTPLLEVQLTDAMRSARD